VNWIYAMLCKDGEWVQGGLGVRTWVLGGFIHSMVASVAVATTAASGDGSDMAAAASGNASET